MKLFHDSTDDLLAAAVHGELTATEQTALKERLKSDPAFAQRYKETQTMHDLLQKNYEPKQPDTGFEQRTVNGVQRRLKQGAPKSETPWESVLFFWSYLRQVGVFGVRYAVPLVLVAVTLSAVLLVSPGRRVTGVFTLKNDQLEVARDKEEVGKDSRYAAKPATALAQREAPASPVPARTSQVAAGGMPINTPVDAAPAPAQVADNNNFNVNGVKRRAVLQYGQTKSEVFIEKGKKASDQNGIALSGYVDTSYLKQFKKQVEVQDGQTSVIGNLEEGGRTDNHRQVSDASRKLIRDATLRLEVNDFTAALEQIKAETTKAGGYLESQNSQRGGNGKLQGTVVVKVLPENLDRFLLKLRDLGDLKNQNVSTQDITSAYYDLQARLGNAQHMEESLLELLKKENGKVADLLLVEKELERVRGEIESMQGQLKLYNFQVALATVTITLAEKDLHSAAAYLLKESDQLALLASDVDGTFQQTRHLAEAAHGEILNANVNRDVNNNTSATLDAMIPPDQIESFLNQVKALGRVSNFVRTTQRVANDGGETGSPADQTKTVQDKVEVNLTINTNQEEPVTQTAQLSVLGSEIESQTQKLKDSATAAGIIIKSSTFTHQSDGQEVADLTFKLPQDQSAAFLVQLKTLGSVEDFTLQRQDQVGVHDVHAPMEISLHFHSRGNLVTENNGILAMLRNTFTNGFTTLLGSIGTIAVLLAFVLPWVIFLAVLAWVARRIYVWYRK